MRIGWISTGLWILLLIYAFSSYQEMAIVAAFIYAVAGAVVIPLYFGLAALL